MGHVTPQRYANAVVGISQTGIYGDSPEFTAAAHKAKTAAKNAEKIEDLYGVLNEAVIAAGGKHSRLITPDENATYDQYTKDNPAKPSVSVNGNIVHAVVPSIAREEDGKAYANTIARGLADALRPGATHACAAVAVLVDAGEASSGEATMLAFRGLENSRSFGQPTAGYASANIVIDYPDGSELMLANARDKARTGELFAEDPIQPDEVIEPAQLGGAGQPVPPQVRAWLTAQGCA